MTAGSGKRSVSQRQGDLPHPPHPLLTLPVMASWAAAAASAPTTTGKETHTFHIPFCTGQWTAREPRPILQEPLPAHYTKLFFKDLDELQLLLLLLLPVSEPKSSLWFLCFSI